MQKIINVLAIASTVVSLAVVGTAGYVYVRKDAIIENIKEKALGGLGGGLVGGALTGDVGAAKSPRGKSTAPSRAPPPSPPMTEPSAFSLIDSMIASLRT